jgi:hypothetical protein
VRLTEELTRELSRLAMFESTQALPTVIFNLDSKAKAASKTNPVLFMAN